MINWNAKKLSEVAKLTMGQSPPSSSYNSEGKGLPFFQGKTDFGYRNPSVRVWTNQPSKTAEDGDIIMSVRAPVGDVNILDTKACLGRGVAGIKPNIEISRDFLYFYLSSKKEEIEKLGTGSIFKAINKSQLANLLINFPDDLKTQAKVTAILISFEERVFRLYQQMDQYQKLKKSLMDKLFHEGLNGEEQKETELGLVPINWNVVPLGKVAMLSTGTTPSTKKPDYYKNGVIPFIKTADIANNRLTKSSNYITEEAFNDYSLKKYAPGTLLLAMYGQGNTRGRISILNIEAATTQNTAAIEPNRRLISSEYLWYYLLSRYEHLRQQSINGQISHLNLSIVKEIKIPLAPVDEQQEIGQVLEAVISKINLLNKKMQLYQSLFDSLLKQLMSQQIDIENIDFNYEENT